MPVNGRHKKSAGVTLIELMIVLIIIGVLATFAIIRFSNATKKAKVREAALMLGYLWDIQYQYYVEHGSFISQEYGIIFFEADLGFAWYDQTSETARKKLNYSPPSGTSRFWYLSWNGGAGMVTFAYPKTSDYPWISEDETDNSLKGITLSVDNDRRIYIYGFGRAERL